MFWYYWCMQNTCMHFVVYWCIFQYIKMLLVVIIMFCNDLWGFSINPPYFGYNSVEQENMFCVFWRFRNLPKFKLTWDFLGVNILSREPSGAQGVNKVGHEDQTSTGGVGPRPGCATQCRLAVEVLMSCIFVPGSSAWPKNGYIKDPPRSFLEEAAEKHKT
jgi:hypothetical protein